MPTTLRRNRTATWVLVALAGVVALTGCDPVTRGHVDAISVRKTGSTLTVTAHNETVSPPRDQETDSLLYVADRDAIGRVPSDPAYRFLGEPGSRIWVLPQVENPSLPWIGWDTVGIPTGFLQQNRIRLRLLAVEGPGPVAVYTVSALGVPAVIFNSDDGLPDTRVVPVGTHQHANWAFRSPGLYHLRMEVTATFAATGTPFRRQFSLWFQATEEDR